MLLLIMMMIIIMRMMTTTTTTTMMKIMTMVVVVMVMVRGNRMTPFYSLPSGRPPIRRKHHEKHLPTKGGPPAYPMHRRAWKRPKPNGPSS